MRLAKMPSFRCHQLCHSILLQSHIGLVMSYVGPKPGTELSHPDYCTQDLCIHSHSDLISLALLASHIFYLFSLSMDIHRLQ